MMKVIKSFIFGFLIIALFFTVYVTYNSFGAFSTTPQPSISTTILKQLPLNTGTTSKYQSSTKTGTTSKDESSAKTGRTYKDQSLANKGTESEDQYLANTGTASEDQSLANYGTETEDQYSANTGTASKDQSLANTGTASKDQSSAKTFNLNFSLQSKENNSKINAVIQFRNLVNKLVHCSNECENITKQETLHLPKNVLTDPVFLRIVKRIKKSKEGCMNDSPELKAQSTQDEGLDMIRDNRHHLSVCINAKAASTSLNLYGKVLYIYNIISSIIEHLVSEDIRKIWNKNSVLDTVQGKMRDYPDSNMKVVVVRHPFQRLVSAYSNKVNNTKLSPGEISSEQFQATLSLSLVPDSETVELLGRSTYKLKCSNSLKGTVGELKPTINAYGQTIPSFRGFILGVIEYKRYCKGNIECLRKGNVHMRSQVLRCGPCLKNYDAILKVETLQEDLSLIERVLGIESAWTLQQQIIKNRKQEYQESISQSGILATNSHERMYSYRDYMNQLAPHEMDMLFEIYINDFNVFGYDPCQDINITSKA